MGKKRKIFILSALAAGVAIFFGRKRLKKGHDHEEDGEWTPADDGSESHDGSADGSGSADSSDDASDSSDSEEATS